MFSSNPGPSWVHPFLISSLRISPRGFERNVFRRDRTEQLVPGFDERLGAFALQIGGQLVIVDARLAELGDHLVRIAAVDGQKLTQFAVIGESK